MDSTILTPASAAFATYGHACRDHDRPLVHLLRNDQMVTMITAAGGGYVRYDGRALTRWRPDPTCDADGYFVYLRDLDRGAFWSATLQPTARQPEEYQAAFQLGSARFFRCDDDIVTELQVCLAPDTNVELRRVTITNQGSTTRRIELTSYAEVVLHDPQADAAHPAFSKLFVETFRDQSGALTACRRARQAGESTIAACHFLAGAEGDEPAEFETDRSRFLGRGQTVASPAVLKSSAPMSGTVGSVLDPVFSLRKVLFLPPTASACVTFAIGAGSHVAELLEDAKRFTQPPSVDAAFDAAEAAAREMHHQTGQPISEIGRSLRAASGVLYGLPTDQTAHESGSNGDGVEAPNRTRHEGDFFEQFGLKPNRTSGPAQNHEVVAAEPNNAALTPADWVNYPAQCHGSESSIFDEPLLHNNGWGGFSADGTEYVIRLRPTDDPAKKLPPLPWVNIVANESAGFIVSETGAGTTWAGNSRLNRLTPWHNDPVSDPPGEAIYIRDDDAQTFWSATPGPVRQPTNYEVRHGFGYTSFHHVSNDFEHELTQFVPRDDALKIVTVRLHNLSDRRRRLTLFSYHHWELGDGSLDVRSHTVTTMDDEQHVVFATNDRRGDYSANYAFAALVPPEGAGGFESTSDRSEFLGHHGSLAAPRALTGGAPLSGRAGKGFDQCAASKTSIEIGPNETIEFAVLLGEAPSKLAAGDILERFRAAALRSAALEEIQQFWRDKLSAVQIETPSSAINLLVNGWLPYQNLSCRVWGRSAFYQSGGAYGYRDQLQDTAALVHHWPELTREQILRHAAHQFVEGDVMHWWHPPASCGIRTTFSDDLLWLPLFAADYVATTGDASLWNENVRFLTAPPVPPGDPEIFLTPEDSGERGTVYEHCCRALDRGLTTGRHGLPLMGCGDWNDGMNRVGQAGSGESVWLGFFIDYILERMLPVCRQFDDDRRMEKYQAYRQQLREALDDAGWDGAWYRRAYFDDGTPLGTASSDECRIDALVQAWAVLSRAVPPKRAAAAMAEAERHLVDERAGLIRLLDPPIDKMSGDPGYIKGYLPGVRENGGQYTHGVLWFIRAMAELGHGTRAAELLEMISPVSHGSTREVAKIYQTEPYVVAADVYGQPPHVGRGGWSWYTGSAGWMWRVAVESILGVRLEGGKTLRIDPRVSADWPRCKIRYRLADGETFYDITIENPDGKQLGVTSARLDGEPAVVEDAVAIIPLAQNGRNHTVVVTL